MSTPAQPIFDMSKAKPIFDMSKAKPIVVAPSAPDEADEAKREIESGAGPAAATMQPGRTAAAVGGMAAVGSLGAPADALVTAVATKSIRPLLPYIVGYFGSKYGKSVMKDVGETLGGLVGEPEAGGKVGGVVGAVGGGILGGRVGSGGDVPFLSPRGLLYSLLKGGPEGAAPAAEAAAPEAASTVSGAATQATRGGGPTLQSYSRDLLVQMARKGDVDALKELIRNPGNINVEEAVPNSRYLLGQVPKPAIGGPIVTPAGEPASAEATKGATIGEQLASKGHRFSNSAKARQLIIDLSKKLGEKE